MGSHPVAVVKYTYTHKQYIVRHKQTIHRTTQKYIEQHKKYIEQHKKNIEQHKKHITTQTDLSKDKLQNERINKFIYIPINQPTRCISLSDLFLVV